MLYNHAIQDSMLQSLWLIDHRMTQLHAGGSEQPVDFWHKQRFYNIYLP